jgi:hypothetical protein
MMESFYTANDRFTIIPAMMLALFGCVILPAPARNTGSMAAAQPGGAR